jgi:hypothetical protein
MRHDDFMAWLRSAGVSYVDSRGWFFQVSAPLEVAHASPACQPTLEMGEFKLAQAPGSKVCCSCSSLLFGEPDAYQYAHQLYRSAMWFEGLLRRTRPLEFWTCAELEAERVQLVLSEACRALSSFARWGDLEPARRFVDDLATTLRNRFPVDPMRSRQAAIRVAAGYLSLNRVSQLHRSIPGSANGRRVVAADQLWSSWIVAVMNGAEFAEADDVARAECVGGKFSVDDVDRLLSELRSVYEEFLADDQEVFFAVSGLGAGFYSVPNSSTEVVLRRNLRAQYRAWGVGSLPSVVVKWLASSAAPQGVKPFELAVPFEAVDDGVYDTALRLWTENEYQRGALGRLADAFQAAVLL